MGKRVHAWREFCQPFEQPGMGCLHNRCVEVFEGKPCALHCWTRLCGQDTDLWVLSVHISGSSVKAILLAFYGDVSAIQFDRYSEIHGSIIQNSQQVDFSLVFWKVPFLLLLFKFHLARLFHLVHQSIIDLWVTKPPVVHVVLEVPRWHMARQQAEAPRWKDGYQQEGTWTYMYIHENNGTELLRFSSWSNLNWTICFVITFYMSALPSGSLSSRSSFHVSKHVLVLEKSTIGP